jgi:hypothetical protein
VPVRVVTHRGLGGIVDRRNGNKMQAVVPHLLNLHPPHTHGRYVVYIDKLYTSIKLLSYLRKIGYGATGTARTNSGIINGLVRLKRDDEVNDNIPVGDGL